MFRCLLPCEVSGKRWNRFTLTLQSDRVHLGCHLPLPASAIRERPNGWWQLLHAGANTFQPCLTCGRIVVSLWYGLKTLKNRCPTDKWREKRWKKSDLFILHLSSLVFLLNTNCTLDLFIFRIIVLVWSCFFFLFFAASESVFFSRKAKKGVKKTWGNTTEQDSNIPLATVKVPPVNCVCAHAFVCACARVSACVSSAKPNWLRRIPSPVSASNMYFLSLAADLMRCHILKTKGGGRKMNEWITRLTKGGQSGVDRKGSISGLPFSVHGGRFPCAALSLCFPLN